MTELPRMIHPATGTDYTEPLYVSPSGRKFYPIGGAAEPGEGGTGGEGGEGGAGGDDAAAQEAAAAKAKAEQEAAAKAGKGDDGKTDAERGYPLNTPEADMSDEQKFAYRTAQMRKHQAAVEKLTRQGMTPEKFEAAMKELDELRTKNMSDSEKAVAEAKAAGRSEAFSELNAKVIQAHVDAFVSVRGVDLEKNPDLAATLDALNLEKFVKDGDVDTDKLVKVLTNLVPDPDKGGKRWPDMGGGKRGGTASSKGVAAGADLFDQVHGSKSK